MGVGLQISNPSGELVVSSDAKLLSYIGKATLQSIVQVSGNAEGGKTTARKSGYSTYTLNLGSDQQFALAIDCPVGYAVGIMNVTRTGVGQYLIKAYCGTGVYDGYGFDTQQVSVNIWAFGFVSSPSNNYGLVLYDKNGNLSADFMRPNLLFPRFIGNFANTPSQVIPSLSRPVIFGMPGYHLADIYDRPDGYLYNYIDDAKFWCRTNATTMTTVKRTLKYYGCNEMNDAPDDPIGDGAGGTGIIMEGNGLP